MNKFWDYLGYVSVGIFVLTLFSIFIIPFINNDLSFFCYLGMIQMPIVLGLSSLFQKDTYYDFGQTAENNQTVENKEENKVAEMVKADDHFQDIKIIIPGKKKKKKSLKERLIQQIENQDRVGRLYEQKIGAIYEGWNYEVEYTGIEKGVEDGGVDLIAKKDDEILLIQCKAWAGFKVIHESYIHQLHGAVDYYAATHNHTCRGVFFCSCSLSDVAKDAAKKHNIEVYENFGIQ